MGSNLRICTWRQIHAMEAQTGEQTDHPCLLGLSSQQLYIQDFFRQPALDNVTISISYSMEVRLG